METIEQITVLKSENKVTDLTKLSLFSNNKSLMYDVISIFLEQNPSELAQIKQAIDTNDFTTIKRISHRMKTSTGFIGLGSKIRTVLEELEKNSEEKSNMEKIKSNFEIVKTVCVKAQNELKAYLNEIADVLK